MAIKLFESNQRDMTDALSDECIPVKMTIGQSIVRGILRPPKYVLNMYSHGSDPDLFEKQIQSAKNKAVRDEASACLRKLRRTLDNAEAPDSLFQTNMTERHGKYIIFAPDNKALQEYMKLADDWFGKIDENLHIYSVYSDDPSANKSFRDFNEDDSDHLRLLYCTDVPDDAVHTENISGVILIRPTTSPAAFRRQIRFALSASEAKTPLIFDIVGNIENLFSIESLKEEMLGAMMYYRSHDKNDLIINDTFEIIDKLTEFKKLFEQLEKTLTAAWDTMYDAAEKYYRSTGSLDPPQSFITEDGYALGAWLRSQRRVRSGMADGTLTDEQIEKLDRIGMRWDSMEDIVWDKYYSAAVEYFNTHLSLNVNEQFVTEDGVQLGSWLKRLRTYRKNRINSSFLTPERIKLLDRIGMLWDVYDYVFERSYLAAAKYYQTHGDLECAPDYVTSDGIRLGAWLQYLRTQYKKSRKFLTDDQYKILNAIGMRWVNKYDSQWDEAYSELCEYHRRNKGLAVPVAYKTENGLLLGRWIRRQLELYNKGQLRPDRIEKLEKLGVVSGLYVDRWQQMYRSALLFYKQNGNLKVPQKYRTDTGKNLFEWLQRQGKQYKNGKLSENKIKMLRQIGFNFDSITAAEM